MDTRPSRMCIVAWRCSMAAESDRADSIPRISDCPFRPGTHCSGEPPVRGDVQLQAVFAGEELVALRDDVQRVFEEYPPDDRGDPPEQSAPFRYEMLNRSGLVQQAIGHPRILEIVEFLLGEDCHVIANTAWWQQPGDNEHLGRFWHIDSGPHVPRDPGVLWEPRIPYPVFAIAAHLYLWDCPIDAGPTGQFPEVIHRDRHPPGQARRRRPGVGRPLHGSDRGRGR